MLGLIVLVAAGLLLLALVSYTPSDPSFNTVGGGAGGRLAHNWTGMVGAYAADLLLQTVGIAIFFVPLALIRIGISWMRSQRVGIDQGEGSRDWAVADLCAGADLADAR
jgi:S-DNA-T family DNA segregation ATPase FtsK/SpoIIIE